MNSSRVNARFWLRKDNRGATVVEFALVSVVAFLVLFGIIEGGRLIFDYHRVSVAAHDGARWVAVHRSASEKEILEKVSEFSMGLVPAETSVNVNDDGVVAVPTVKIPGQFVHITARAMFHPIVGLVPIPHLILHSSASMLIHH